ncbi:MAG: hypothetical protein U0175_30240 [Caldilineaceae bacterium]
MAETLRLFISATRDLEAERAIIGRAIARLPVEIGIEIRRTPFTGAPYEDIYEWIANVDRVFFLMGEDITAPAGMEWFTSWKLERTIIPLRRGSRHTQAALEFMRTIPVKWINFNSGAELARIITLEMARILNHPQNRYGLTLTELEKLHLHASLVEKHGIRTENEAGGAQGGAVLLDIGHREPLDGELVTG